MSRWRKIGPSEHRIPEGSFLYNRFLPGLILGLGALMGILILIAAGVLLGVVPFQ